MTRILDTTPDFVALTKAAFLQDPVSRRDLWDKRYRARYPAVFDAFFAGQGAREQVPALVHRLSDVRKVVDTAAPVMPALIEEVEPAVREALGIVDVPEPLHVLMVGTFSTNACVVHVDDDIAVLHCLEWFSDPETTRVLVAHEDTHAWHETVRGSSLPEDLAWTAFAEGLALQVSRAVVPDRPEADYFWYGVAGFEDWLPWCREHRDLLLDRFAESLDNEGGEGDDATEAFFGAGFVEQRWRTGFYVADELVRSLDVSPPDLVRMDADEARKALRTALDRARS